MSWDFFQRFIYSFYLFLCKEKKVHTLVLLDKSLKSIQVLRFFQPQNPSSKIKKYLENMFFQKSFALEIFYVFKQKNMINSFDCFVDYE